MGSAALYSAAKKGWRVLGIEQHELGHAFGSSHGQTRIIRQAYYEHPSYVPLSFQSFERWRDIESYSGESLLLPNGLLQVGHPDHELIKGITASANQHSLDVEYYSTDECRVRFPQFRIPDDHVGIFERQAGILRVEKCVTALAGLARDSGAELVTGQPVTDVDIVDSDSMIVRAGDQSFSTARLVICAGAWSASWLSKLQLTCIPIQIVVKHQHWFELPALDASAGTIPTYLLETEDGHFYGFPNVDAGGYKVAEHSGGQPIAELSKIDRGICPADVKRVTDFIRGRIHSDYTHLNHAVCMYSVTPDQHFIVDRASHGPNITFAAGFSGHGFKFAPIIGDYLIKLLEDQRDPLFDFLKADRPIQS